MAQVVTVDAFLLTLYKRWYDDKGTRNLLFRNSPALRKIQKERIGGQTYNFSAMYGRGGAVSGDYLVAQANAASMSRNAEFAVPPGKLFSVFTIQDKEIKGAMQKKGAYDSALVNRMFGATEAFRKTFAACLYGDGFGTFGVENNVAGVAGGANTTVLTPDAILKIDVGSQFQVTAGITGLPGEALLAGGPYTVTAIDDATGTITFAPVAAGAGWPQGSLYQLNGGRDAGGAPNMPTGLQQWLPHYGMRAGANWLAYIAAAFYGVARNLSVGALAGRFYRRNIGAGERFIDALVNGVMLCRRGGGVPNLILVNDVDFATMVGEVNAALTMFQNINATPDKASKNEVVRGLNALRFSFSTNWLEYVVDDPYCPAGSAYILDDETYKFLAMTNADTPVQENVTGNEPGTDKVGSVEEPDTTFKLSLSDYITVTPNNASAEGPAAQVTLALYGNFACFEPGHNAVVSFI